MPVSKGPDCVGEEMRRFKSGDMHSGENGPTVKNKKQAIAIALSSCGKSKYSEMLQGLGFNEHAANTYAEMYDFISAKDAAEISNEGELGDIDSTPGKQKPLQVTKQDQQGMAATFPTLPKQAPGKTEFDEGPMVKARKGRCPTGTSAVGGGFCRNSKPGKRQYFEVEKGKGCPPGSKTAGKGRCRVDFAERLPQNQMPQISVDSARKAIESNPCPPKEPKAAVSKPTQPTQPTGPTQPNQPVTPERQMLKDTAKKKAEQCSKQRGN